MNRSSFYDLWYECDRVDLYSPRQTVASLETVSVTEGFLMCITCALLGLHHLV
jgi:hypothetical protein